LIVLIVPIKSASEHPNIILFLYKFVQFGQLLE
jgi:hypothetical protein